MKPVLLAASLALATHAGAQSFPAQTDALPTRTSCLGCFSTAPVPISGDELVFLNKYDPADNTIKDYGALALKNFAGSGDMSALQSHLNKKVSRGTALASATDMIGPAEGTNSRIGGSVTESDGHAAGAVTFVHRIGRADIGGAFGYAKGAHVGKASAGFSF